MSEDIYTILKTKAINEHYLKRYINFINSVQGTGSVQHHILPKADDMFPEYKDLTKHKWNNARIAERHHYVAHWMLYKALGGSQATAFFIMTNALGCRRGRDYEAAREEFKQRMSDLYTGISRDNPQNKNPDKIRKTAEAHRGMKRSKTAKKNMSKAAKNSFKNGRVQHNSLRYHTPYGTFESRNDVYKALGLKPCVSYNRCVLNVDKKNTPSSLSRCYDINKDDYIGKTWREMGWYATKR